MKLIKYKEKRDFENTPEPEPKEHKSGTKLHFSVQRHQASHLHYDLRLEMDGVLKSWAIPKGPSMNANVKRLAMQTEDHPYDYMLFEGEIPKGNYGAGTVEVWDKGTYTEPEAEKGKAEKALLHGLHKGHIQLLFKGKKLKGVFDLIHIKNKDEDRDNSWLLTKRDDEFAVTDPYNAEDHLD